ncbi:hypothetical protein P152DRAFT_398634 [Eremomyces bilateralis CBS 781.70]|uniref:VWFA domain-containing protein n=1 Tax=Eremomyces bilateralis CBS 781.70 TaxID=1392243 RepID=A0A6G1G149_9PEZI|nr:uncharacterized protein P152DRAFT_398634 [Eremomyces bilateralis CBS 781.70]KAF1811835.1 hypothetical protein P152DRAFT_398634 [Eremomyces bilateralis CBS 781.70]
MTNGHILPIQSKLSDAKAQLELHPLPEGDAVLVRVKPPMSPPNSSSQTHVPCDVVLVIDISGSMGDSAPLPPNGSNQSEDTGLCVLDLVKHAAKVIIASLADDDRLGIVSFHTHPEVVQSRLPMTNGNKKSTIDRIEQLHPKMSTNLWGGIREGLKLFEDGHAVDGNVPALIVLTDGQPNHMCPPQGYLPKLIPILNRMAKKGIPPITINTFGFGYNLRSGLLQCIAEEGNGSYAYIPDAGMIGTVFVHAMANLFNTFAAAASLTFITSPELALDFRGMVAATATQIGGARLKIGNLQYGQSRDIVLAYGGKQPRLSSTIQVSLRCRGPSMERLELTTATSLSQRSSLPDEYCQYQRFRTRFCHMISSLFPASANGEYKAVDDPADALLDLEELATDINCSGLNDPLNTSLFNDLCGPEPMGQVKTALSHGTYWQKWGAHYLRSLLSAHSRQVCNSFKDSGPLQYGSESPVFIRCRDQLDEIFDNLPAPKSSPRPAQTTGRTRGLGAPPPYTPLRMSRYRNFNSSCFAGHCLIQLSNGRNVPVRSLRPGMSVWTPAGFNTIKAIVGTRIRRQKLCRIGNLWITPWHPVCSAEGQWAFPIDIAEETRTVACPVYSLLLNHSPDPDAHAVRIGSIKAVTLGHGITKGNDIRTHAFFGDWMKVKHNLVCQGLLDGSHHVQWVDGVWKDEQTGLAGGFLKPSSLRRKRPLSKRLGGLRSWRHSITAAPLGIAC